MNASPHALHEILCENDILQSEYNCRNEKIVENLKKECQIRQEINNEEGPELNPANALTSLVTLVPNDANSSCNDDEFDIPERFALNGRRKAISFPLKLMKMLSCKQYTHIIAWHPESDGKAFHIVDRVAFTTFILPRHFKQAKFSSFTRKLLRWGFERVRHLRGKKYATFSHESFQRNRLDLMDKISHNLMNDDHAKGRDKMQRGDAVRLIHQHHQNNPVASVFRSGNDALLQNRMELYQAIAHHEAPFRHDLQQMRNPVVSLQQNPNPRFTDGILRQPAVDLMIEMEVMKWLVSERAKAVLYSNALNSFDLYYPTTPVRTRSSLMSSDLLPPTNRMDLMAGHGMPFVAGLSGDCVRCLDTDDVKTSSRASS